MPEPPRVSAVVDTQLLVRGILRRRPQSHAVRLFDAIIERRFELVLSEYVLAEVRRTLRDPDVRALAPRLSSAVLDATAEALRDVAKLVPGALAVQNVRDPKDNPIVACALEGGASHIVSDDKDLLVLDVVRVTSYRPVRVVLARAFLDEVLGLGRG